MAEDGDGNHRLIELEDGRSGGFSSEDSSVIHSPWPGNLRARGPARDKCYSWQSDDVPDLPQDEEREWTQGRTRFSSFGGSDLELRWEALSMCSWQVSRKSQEAVQILTNVSGAARAGKITCILGPSGSGKTTLLNVLAGRQSGGHRHRIRITGQVWVSGSRVDPRAVRSRMAYVMQKDEMFATSTPTEALSFSASLRLSGPRDRKELISELLGSLGLRSCSHTYIGNAVLNGLSGGQRKRTAIGVELITRPDIVCLDEPTSGLDSFAAYQVMSVLKDLGKAGCTIICTLHQPSSEIFALVDQVICLCDGRCLWAGDREQMVGYFSTVGYPCPVGFNPADFVIFLMQTEPKSKTDELTQIWTRKHAEAAAFCSESSLTSPYDEHELCRTPKVRSGFSTAQKGFGQQLRQLAKRELRAVVRDRTTLAVRVTLSVVLTFLFGLVFQGVGRTILETKDQNIFDQMWTGLTYAEVTALRKRKLEWHFNALVQVALVAMFSACQPVILTFPLERPVFLREYSSGTYSVLPYYLSKMVVEVPLVFVQSLMTLGLCYVVMSLNGNFWALLWTIVLLSVCSVSVALAISCAVRQPRETGAVGPLVFVPQMLFSGVFIPVSHMPVYLRWMQYFSFLQYAIKVLGIVEFRHVPHKELVLDAQDILEDSLWVYVGLLVLMVLIFSLTGIQMLRNKATHLF
ncbi:unnamed protein product [Effrenium voratum]|uniref:ABC transporter domain-containing protein n=1 Tax=Effrenium voratum TaxID=2562239 RepID=A0AA36IV36_9DINO|nr:unnamed protein product [Effrenium voratum]CAJ1444715.1 unnamed protein product [Effrenium voratum]